MSSQGSVASDFMSSSQTPIFNQESVQDTHNVPNPNAGSSYRKRKRGSSPDVLANSSQVTVTSSHKRKTPQTTPTKPVPSIPTSRYLQLQARGTDEVFKMNEATLAKTSDLFKYKLYHSTRPSSSPAPAPGANDNPPETDQPPSSQPPNTLIPSTPISPASPVVRLNTTSQALFLYCLWVVAPPDRLSLYLDSTIPRPSYTFTIYLYEAFLLALELKDTTFLHHLITVILKDEEAGWPGEAEIAWVYENTGPGHALRRFVVDCTLTWADEAVGKWGAWVRRTPAEFVVDVSCRMLELGKGKWGWMKTNVATKYTCGVWWSEDYLDRALEGGEE
ncbi:hypothetical protein P171DRAFT_485868 [Karstenula rhodostoma CBS 690.94]|uniref:BTB domain-containing protein n=1 Tax=Karstenula rhodostoma CBS 690.94 TaxID=1392251 RepID=A0A9P4UBR1_9PLEO|nr:hypothetical protein P171DRAFT_485868 [Karstenula rhodostoma CBS 690.94]